MSTKKVVSLFLSLALLLSSNLALAETVNLNFDPTGTAGASGWDYIGGWSYDQQFPDDQQSWLGGGPTYVDIITYQALTGGANNNILDNFDTFREDLFISIEKSLAPAPNSGTQFDYDPYDLNFAFSLKGYIKNYNDGGTPTTLGGYNSLADDFIYVCFHVWFW